MGIIHEDRTEELSAYLDGRLSDAERAALEYHMRACSRCQNELDELQSTIMLLRAVPVPPPPRSFTLDPADFAPQGNRWLPPLRWAAAALTMLLVLTVGIDLLNVGAPQEAQTTGAGAPASEAQQPTAAAAALESADVGGQPGATMLQQYGSTDSAPAESAAGGDDPEAFKGVGPDQPQPTPVARPEVGPQPTQPPPAEPTLAPEATLVADDASETSQDAEEQGMASSGTTSRREGAIPTSEELLTPGDASVATSNGPASTSFAVTLERRLNPSEAPDGTVTALTVPDPQQQRGSEAGSWLLKLEIFIGVLLMTVVIAFLYVSRRR